MEKDEEGGYVVSVPSLPGCISQGKTEEEAREKITEAIELHLTALARDGIPIIPNLKKTESFVSVQI
ncbi:type II toxin-antitoxin system HicB family antitoxin [Methanospirillum hungatei]|uniref:type II toxin-antitoxin system HicB family antitoxin n=1 Tax=Methanospirillum hungatei TaxID=2203 RepID=UPI0023A9ECCE|nr:type II toxin-antitoxin system HicB family antitoxin [Methanospirillum hungatei]